ncbi:hypothetical protein [Streptomyces sp. NPDC007369]|uniref:hypothetical protein n=1 Tax=Streptomyces sp. NPDC007369 TaxID=3154589 RepID=UPI0033D246D6
MGASGWDYVTEYAGGVEASLAALHARVFAEQFGEGGGHPDLASLWADHEFMGTQGTHSVLDVTSVRHDPGQEYGTVAPLAADRVLHHFGTDRPTVAMYEEAIARAERAMSHEEYVQSLVCEADLGWNGLYVLLYTGEEVTHVGFFGSSGD